MRYDLVILDVDGVLTADTTSPAQTEAMLTAVRKYARKPDLTDHGVERHGRTDEQVLLDLLSNAGRHLRELPKQVADDYAAAYRPNEQLRPDAKVALRDLMARGMKMTVASGNLKAILARKLSWLGVQEFLSEPLGHGGMARERSEILRKQKELWGLRAVYVCDTWQDVVAGHQAGLDCVMMPSREHESRTWLTDVAWDWKELHGWLVRG